MRNFLKRLRCHFRGHNFIAMKCECCGMNWYEYFKKQGGSCGKGKV